MKSSICGSANQSLTKQIIEKTSSGINNGNGV